MGFAFQTASMTPFKYDTKKSKIDPAAKSDATGLRPMKDRLSSTVAHVMQAHNSFV
jgi:hypothetical protein